MERFGKEYLDTISVESMQTFLQEVVLPQTARKIEVDEREEENDE